MKKIFLIIFIVLFLNSVVFSANTKTSDLPENTEPAETDIFYMVDDPSGSPAGNKITKANLMKNIQTESISVAKAPNAPGYNYLREAETTNELTSGFQGPDDLSANISYKLPDSAGTVDQVLAFESVETGQTLPNGETGTIVTLKNASAGIGTLSYSEGATDPTSSSTANTFYGNTTDGGFFFKSGTGIFDIVAGTYTADPATYNLTLGVVSDGTITISAIDYTSLGSPHTITGLSGTVNITGAYGGSNDTLAWTGDTVTGTYPNYTIDMGTANKSVTATFSQSASSVTDNFNRADGALGANWGAVQNLPEPTVSTNQIFAFNEARDCYWSADSFSANQYSEAVFVEGDNGGVAVRMQVTTPGSLTPGYYAFPSGGSIYLRRSDAESGTNLQMYPTTLVATDTLRLEASGSSLTVYVNNVALTPSITDTTYSSGDIGLMMGSYQRWDNWEGGNL